MERIIIIIFCFTLLCGTLVASEADRRNIRALADQGLFPAAESFYNERIQQPGMAESDKILLAAELVRSHSRHLLLLEPAARPRIIQRLEALERNWLSQFALTNRELALAQIYLRLQLATAYSSLGEYQRLEAEIASITNRRPALRQAQATLENALERLQQCQREYQSLPPPLETALGYSITVQQAIAQKSLALTLPTEAERSLQLRQAIQTLSKLGPQGSTVQSKTLQAACHRLIGELDQSAEILRLLMLQPLMNTHSPTDRLRVMAEWIRHNIARGNIDETRRNFAADRGDVHLYPDFELARLELFLASAPAQNIRAATPTVMRLEEAITRQLGGYWARRAQLLVIASGNSELNSAEMLATRADNHYREGRFAEAARYYEQAARRADANRQEENLFRFNHLAADAWTKALEQLPPDESRAEYQQRIVALMRKLVEQAPNHPEAFGFHTLALSMQAQVVMSQPEALDDYLALAAEHAELWSESPQLPHIRLFLVIFLERQGRLDEAAAMLPLLDLAHLPTLPPEIQRLRASQLDAAGETQEAIGILRALLQQRREPATLHLLAEILTRQEDAASLNQALRSWAELESLAERHGEMWWTAREGMYIVLFKLGRQEEARRSFEMLRVLHPSLGGAERRERLTTLFAGHSTP